ncbi:trans-aconitate 2-methyltransferase [Microvirga sp. VF16]|uniref:class I SAM-dependent methyltransferase n=1 Tax=Microvirga sp. VF16 TaxID=2807101 RepID=UPI00193E718B|nr:class I SAM-dependent methyltransferase [Microvirga sp. VF16]QRM35607.1 class I SAM-dependent methyltransferase [Microvirga sp. VF16]
MSAQAPAPALSRLSNLRPSAITEASRHVDWTYMPGDPLLGPAPNYTHYKEVGESAARAIYGSLLLANVDAPRTVLDFGSGGGRATRWLRALFPEAAIEAADPRPESLQFVADQFGVSTWQSSFEIQELAAPRTYDLIWSGSVLTHLPEYDAQALLAKFMSWLEPNGVCVVTTHGRRMIQNMQERRLQYIARDLEPAFMDQLADKGYAWVPYKGKSVGTSPVTVRKGRSLGVSATTVPWLTETLKTLDARVVTISEHAWDKHQDVVAFQAPGPR